MGNKTSTTQLKKKNMGQRLIISESERASISKMYGLINEANSSQLMGRPTFQYAIAKSGNDSIVISGIDTRTQETMEPIKFDVSGTYDPGRYLPNINFDVNIKNLNQQKSGNLTGEVKPDSSAMLTAMKSAVPSRNRNGDYLILNIPTESIKDTINTLSRNGGKSAGINVGHGVTVNLTNGRIVRDNRQEWMNYFAQWGNVFSKMGDDLSKDIESISQSKLGNAVMNVIDGASGISSRIFNKK